MWTFLSPHLRSCLLALAFTLGAVHPASAVTLTEGPAVKATPSSATITWSTDVASGSKVSYGTSAEALTQRAEGDVTSTHTVTLPDLQAGTTYYYVVGSARAKLGNGSFTTSGKGAGPTTTTVTVEPKKKVPVPPPAPAVTVKVPGTRATWASVDSLPDHFARHGGDFKATSADDYAAQAWLFLQRAKQESLPMKWDDSDSTLRVWDPAQRIFAAYTRAGKTRTFFKPGNPAYWTKQPGRAVRPGELPF